MSAGTNILIFFGMIIVAIIVSLLLSLKRAKKILKNIPEELIREVENDGRKKEARRKEFREQYRREEAERGERSPETITRSDRVEESDGGHRGVSVLPDKRPKNIIESYFVN